MNLNPEPNPQGLMPGDRVAIDWVASGGTLMFSDPDHKTYTGSLNEVGTVLQRQDAQGYEIVLVGFSNGRSGTFTHCLKLVEKADFGLPEPSFSLDELAEAEQLIEEISRG